MIEEIKFLRGTSQQWLEAANASRIIPKGTIGIEFVIENGNLVRTKMKIGYDLQWQLTPYVADDGSAIPVLPETLVYYKNGGFILIDSEGDETSIDVFNNFNISDYLGEDQNLLTDNELTEFRKLILVNPSATSFSSSLSNGLTGATISGNVTLSFNINNKENIKDGNTGRISVSQGSWSGLTFNAKDNNSVQITLNSPITINSAGSLRFSLYVTNIFDKEIKLRDVNVTYRGLVYYGSSVNNDVTNYSDLSNLFTDQVTNKNQIGTLEFNHSGLDSYDYLFIENSISQSGINIVDFNLQNTPNSFGMFKVQDVTISGKVFSVYVTDSSSFGNTKAVVK